MAYKKVLKLFTEKKYRHKISKIYIVAQKLIKKVIIE